MRNSTHFRLFFAFVAGFLSLGEAMFYEPFPDCTERAQVDSIHITVQKGENLDSTKGPYFGSTFLQYFPGTCYNKLVVEKSYYPKGSTYTTEYFPRSNPGIFNFVQKSPDSDSFNVSGTQIYSSSGELDSSNYRYITRMKFDWMDSVWVDTGYGQAKYTRTPQYQLIKLFDRRQPDSAWEFQDGDSAVSNGSGKIIYGLVFPSITTRCIDEGITYVCSESGGGSNYHLKKMIWFLTQGRKDSLQTWENGDLITTEKYFWSARSAGIWTPRIRPHLPAANAEWNDFDIMGRTTSDRTRWGRNKAWLRTRF